MILRFSCVPIFIFGMALHFECRINKNALLQLFFDSSFQTPMDNSVETTGTGSFYCCQNISMITDTNAIKTKFMD